MALEDRIRLPLLNLIHRRARLLNRLTEFIETDKRLITIYAPGGYGKSILLADFAQTVDLPVCWCSLETSERDPNSFLNLLAYSITDRFHSIEAAPLFGLVQRGDTRASIHRIVELLAQVGPHIIIIDDYHKAVSAGMTLTLNRLLLRLPDYSGVIVAARGDMEIETGQILDLLIANKAAGLAEDDLRFTAPEIQRVILKRFGRQIAAPQAEEIGRMTGGNIAQILLTGHIAHRDQNIGDLRQRLGSDQDTIYSYLAAEVFDKQPPPLQRFMLCTAVLPDMTVELCNDLLQTNDSQTYIETMIRNDLFINQTGAGFRYHDMFAEFLRGKLAQDQSLFQQVVTRAAKILTRRSRFEEAINLYRLLQAWEEIAMLLEEHGHMFYNTARALTLNTWLSQLPDHHLGSRPRLLLLKGQILSNDLGELVLAQEAFKHAEARFGSQNNLIGVAEARIWQAVGLRLMGRVSEGLALAVDSVAQLANLHAGEPVMAWAIENRGKAYSTAGNTEAALADLRAALAMYQQLGNSYRVGGCHHDIGVCLVKQGNISGAEHHYQQALRIWELLGNANNLSNTLNSLGVGFYLQGQYAQALTRFEESYSVAQNIEAPRRAAFALAGMGDTYLADKKYDLAVEAYTVSSEYAREAGVASLEIYNQVKRGECFFQQQNWPVALKLVKQARDLASETGVKLEYGLACALQARVYVRQAQYEASFRLFAEALTHVSGNDLLEQTGVHLWWAYGLLLDLQTLAALDHVQEAIKLALAMGELVNSLGATVQDVCPVLYHFLHRVDTGADIRKNIHYLLGQREAQSKDMGVQVFALGKPTVIVAGSRKRFSQRGRTRKLPEFLMYLILEGQNGGCRWDEVCAKLWPDMGIDKTSITFHQHLRRLREALFETGDYVTVQDDYYQIDPHALEWCDALAYDRLFARAAKADPAQALALYLEMVSLYHGEFLAGFELGEWGEGFRHHYEVRFLQAVALATELLLKQNNLQEALAVINKGLARDYFSEDLHCYAFKAYARLGLYDQMIVHYKEMIGVFMREFGEKPSDSTVQVFENLIKQRPRFST